MQSLIGFELKKTLLSRTFLVFVILTAVIMTIFSAAEYSDVKDFRENASYQQEVMSWQEREQNAVRYGKESLEEDEWLTPLAREQVRRRIAIAQYRLENNIPKDVYKNVWWFFNDRAFNTATTFLLVMVIITAGTNMAGEYHDETIRQVLLLPYKRWRIISSKIISSVLSALILYGILFVLGIISGLILHGTGRLDAKTVLYLSDSVTTMKMSTYSIIVVLLKLTEIIFYIIFAVFLAVITKNAGITIIISSLTGVFSNLLGNFIVPYYRIVAYIPFLNLDFRKYLDFGTVLWQSENGFESVVYENITAPVSVSVFVISVITMLFLSVQIFRKQDH